MRRKAVKLAVCTLATTFTFAGAGISAEAAPMKGTQFQMVALESPEISTQALVELAEEVQFRNLVIAQVNNYVNVRSLPDEGGEIVGKLYDDSVGTFLGEENGWYKISSGNVTGYVKAEYCITGEAAVALAREVRDLMATVTTQTLSERNRLRHQVLSAWYPREMNFWCWRKRTAG